MLGEYAHAHAAYSTHFDTVNFNQWSKTREQMRAAPEITAIASQSITATTTSKIWIPFKLKKEKNLYHCV